MSRIVRWFRDNIIGQPEPVAYRISHVFNYRRPFPLMQLLLAYSGDSTPNVPRRDDPFFVYRDEIHEQMRKQVQTLALLEMHYKYHERIPPKTWDGLPHPDFHLEVSNSLIPGAGKGVFMHGSAKTGQIVALHPGLAYFQVPQGKIDQYGLNLRWPRGSRDHIVTLDRSIWIDGNPRSQVVTNAVNNQIWARGHLINHPTGDFAPNVVPCLFDFGPDFVSQSNKRFLDALAAKKINLEDFVPTEFAWEFARAESEHIPACAFVAVRDIENGEELFYDYEWEYNINYVRYSMAEDIAIDWPWYRTIDQSLVDPIIEPWVPKLEFEKYAKTEWRLIYEKGGRKIDDWVKLADTDTGDKPTPSIDTTATATTAASSPTEGGDPSMSVATSRARNDEISPDEETTMERRRMETGRDELSDKYSERDRIAHKRVTGWRPEDHLDDETWIDKARNVGLGAKRSLKRIGDIVGSMEVDKTGHGYAKVNTGAWNPDKEKEDKEFEESLYRTKKKKRKKDDSSGQASQ